MKRTLAILLLTVFGLPLATPLFAISQSGGKTLPVCCRRAGKHHCSESTAAFVDHASKARFLGPVQRCPYYPQATAAPHHEVSTPANCGSLFTAVVSHPSGLAQTESKRRISRDRSRQKRGPPALSRA